MLMKKFDGIRGFLRLVVPAVVVLTSILTASSALADAVSPPSVESESASNITPTDATLGAEVNLHEAPNGAYYQFQLVTDPSEYASEILCPPTLEPGYSGCVGPQGAGALPIGFLPGNTLQPGATLDASLDLASAGVTLQPGTTYHYRVLVARRVQTEDTIEWEPPTVYGADQTFTTPVGTVPSIDSESVSHITTTDATLEAQINPESLERGVHYQFQIVTDTSEYAAEFACHPGSFLCLSLPSDADALPIGFVPAGLEDRSVSLDLASAGMTLHPRTTYHYRVIAARAVPSEDSIEWEAPIVYGTDQTFTTAPSSLDNAEPPSSNGSDPPVIDLMSTANAQKLARALKVCEKKPRKQQARCRKRAHKRYARRSKLAR
jgi:hypothetical protein